MVRANTAALPGGGAMLQPTDQLIRPRAGHAKTPPVLDIQGVRFAYNRQPVLRDVSFNVHYGEVVALLGANGAGKSTLMRIMLGLMPPGAGTVLLQGRPLSSYHRREMARFMAYVPQYHVCPFPYSVRDVVAMGRFTHTGMFGSLSVGDHDAILAELERFHIAHLADRPYTEISGGERQLVLLCRAIMQGARLLLLDEPASALDFGHQARLLAKLKRLADEGYAVVMSTHHPQHARILAHRAVLMKDGYVIGDGAPADILSDAVIQNLYRISDEEMALLKPHLGG